MTVGNTHKISTADGYWDWVIRIPIMFQERHCTGVVYDATAILSQTSPVRETILIQRFDYTLVIFISVIETLD